MKPDRRPIWQATYKTRRGTEFSIRGTSTNECPASLITPQSFELVQIFARSKQIGGENGSITLYGPDLRKWPARMADAFCIMETERVRTDQGRMNAEAGESGNQDR